MGRRSLLVCVGLLLLVGLAAVVALLDPNEADVADVPTHQRAEASAGPGAPEPPETRAPRKARERSKDAAAIAAEVQAGEKERHTLEVIVLDESSDPVAGAEVDALDLQGDAVVDSVTGSIVRGTTDERGRALLVSHDYGYVTLVARKGGRVAIDTGQVAGVGESLTLRLVPAVIPSGRVLSVDGRPVPGVQVWLTFAGDGFPTTTRDNGTFVSTAVPAGLARAPLRYVIRGPGIDELRGTLAAEKYDAVALEFVVECVFRVTGRLVGASGQPLPGVTVRARAGRSIDTKADGTFALERVPAVVDALDLVVGMTDAGSIPLDPGGSGQVDLGDVAVEDINVVTGSLRTRTRIRGRSAVVTVEREIGRPGPSVVVDKDGRFAATVAGAGPFTLVARHIAAGAPAEGARVDGVLPGADVTLHLAAASTLRIAFRDATPWPPGHVSVRVTVERPGSAPRLFERSWRVSSPEPITITDYLDGDLDVTVKLTGFEPATVREVRLSPSQTTDIAITLTPATK